MTESAARGDAASPVAAPRFVGVVAAASAATALLARFGVASADDISVERLAASAGLRVVYTAATTASGRTVHAGGRGFVAIDERERGTERARWTIAHELGHFILHPTVDALERIHGGGPRLRMDHNYEREADAFAAELLLPTHLFACRATVEAPSLDLILELGREFGTSLQATGRRFARLATSACALVEIDEGHIFWAEKSKSFRGVAVRHRSLEGASVAAAVTRGELRGTERAVAVTQAWGRPKLGVSMTEDVLVVPETGVVAAWLWHAPTSGERPPRGGRARRLEKEKKRTPDS